MDKRGQIYIMAAIVLIVAVWGVVKVVNKVEGPSKEDNFDFYVENFVGERAYVMDLGYLQGNDPTSHFIDDLSNQNNLLDVFTQMGLNVGVVMVVYDDARGWNVVNFLSEPVDSGCDGCKAIEVVQPAQGEAGGLTFSLTGEGKQFFLDDSTISSLGATKYFVKDYASSVPSVYVEIDGNRYDFQKPQGKSDRVESIIFKNLDEDYVKVVRV
jgi:hypothetical protein